MSIRRGLRRVGYNWFLPLKVKLVWLPVSHREWVTCTKCILSYSSVESVFHRTDNIPKVVSPIAIEKQKGDFWTIYWGNFLLTNEPKSAKFWLKY